MSWQRYLMHDFYTAKEFNRLEQKIARSTSEKRVGDRRVSAEVERLKDDLGRAYLMISALTELCLRKGVISEEELSAVLHDIDIRDGIEDGKMTPPPDESEATTPEQFLRELERKDL